MFSFVNCLVLLQTYIFGAIALPHIGNFTYLGRTIQSSIESRGFRGAKSNGQVDLYISDGKNSWDDSFSTCKDDLGGQLLSIESAEKQSRIDKYITSYTLSTILEILAPGEIVDMINLNRQHQIPSPYAYIWTSGSYDQEQRKWFWLSTQSSVNYVNWKVGLTPNTGPAYRIAYHKGIKPYWESMPKSNLYRYICELSPVVPVALTASPTVSPSIRPTVTPSVRATAAPTERPTVAPTVRPTVTPTLRPTVTPTVRPTVAPTVRPTGSPTVRPTVAPPMRPTTVAPTVRPTGSPTVRPTVAPTVRPTTVAPTVRPTVAPTVRPTVVPTVVTTGVAEICPSEINVIVLLQANSNVRENHYTACKNVVAAFARDISDNPKFKMGFMIYAQKTLIMVDLKNVVSLQSDDTVEEIIRAPYLNREGTNTASAILLGIDALKNTSRLSRAIVVLTDGKSDNVENTLNSIKAAQNAGIDLYAAGIGPHEQWLTEEINAIAGNKKENVMIANNINLNFVLTSLQNKLCK